MPAETTGNWQLLVTLLSLLAASVWLGTLAQRSLARGKFLEGFFLGNRGLGAWALALTATVQSGGTFMGFPALVYSHGWVVALWIAGYMVVPLTGFAVLGKRLALLSRLTGAITVPDLFRGRFASPAVGLVASLLILFFLSFTMIAQFKAGATIMKLAWPDSGFVIYAQSLAPSIDVRYYLGLTVFAVTVVGYTLIGGFLASVWTDLFQSLLMVVGVMILLLMALPVVGGLEPATKEAIAKTSPQIALAPGYEPGGREFLPISMATSMFVMWVFGGFATPASMVRVMAAQNTEVIRKSIALLSLYNCLIYLPLVAICIAARTLLPDLQQPDEVIPRMAILLTDGVPGGPWVAGLVLAAPFGAVMASVSCFLLVISSSIVQDVYLRCWRPSATADEIRRVTTITMMAVGTVAVLANLNPPKYLQALVVFSTSVGAAAFVTPGLMTCYWRRATAPGCLAAMLAGFGTYLCLFVTGWIHGWALAIPEATAGTLVKTVLAWLGPDANIGLTSNFRTYYLLGLDPVLWSLAASAIAGVVVSLLTRPLPDALLDSFFPPDPHQRMPVSQLISEASTTIPSAPSAGSSRLRHAIPPREQLGSLADADEEAESGTPPQTPV